MRQLRGLATLGIGLCILISAPSTSAKTIKKTIKNPTDQPANDLHVCTTGDHNNRTHAPGWSPPAGYGNGSYCVDWPPGSGSVPAGGSVTVKVSTGHNGAVDDKNTYLTFDDKPLTVTPCTCGCGQTCCSCLWVVDGNNLQRFDFSPSGEHVLTIVNREPVPVSYTNVVVWLGNDNSAGQVDSLDLFDTPTGTPSALVPPIIELDAFRDTTFILEPYAPATYDLFVADEMNSCHPTLESAEIAMAAVPESPSASGQTPSVPRFDMFPNYPNPFNPNTTIGYRIPEAGHVRLAIYDVEGRLLAVMVDAHMPEGHYTVTWEGKDSDGNQLPSGSYFARLEFEGSVRSRTMVLLK